MRLKRSRFIASTASVLAVFPGAKPAESTLSSEASRASPEADIAESGKSLCPKCSAKAGLPLVNGFPGCGTFEAAQRGEIALGGCCIVLGSLYSFQCSACGHEW